ncbi:Hypothetical predicted protein [Podarcis lilfordi]|uniref:Uncharacterized protein n=1 Tax=Podarcis lilfordi TaxID=74358 RepID=A0AA35LBT8_9SAUR|nr:Hypothetical predicted protein [Podarcis lilfordi]
MLQCHQIFSAGENKAGPKDGNYGGYELTLGKPSTSSTSNKNIEYNTLEIHNVAIQNIRYGVGLHATTAIIAVGFIDDLITEEDKGLVVDHNKVKRAKENVTKSLDQEFDYLCQKGETDRIFSDGHKDPTEVMLKSTVPQHNHRTFFSVQ